MGEKDNEIFIDADEYVPKSSNYDEIILRQINKCVDVLSMEVKGGYTKESSQQKGTTIYVEDVRQLIINSVETLKALIDPFIDGKYKESLDIEYEKINKFKEELNKRKIFIPGRGDVAVGNLAYLDTNSPIYKEFIEVKCKIYRGIFASLIKAYRANKELIKSYEIE